jgi:hypothetical protein
MAAGHRESAWVVDMGGATVRWLIKRAWNGLRFTANGRDRIEGELAVLFSPADALLFAVPGRKEALDKLAESLREGDPAAWTGVIGFAVLLVLVSVLSIVLGRRRKAHDTAGQRDAAQIAAALKKRLVACWIGVGGIVVAGSLGILIFVIGYPIGGVLVGLILFFLALIPIIMTNRCPACGAVLGEQWSPKACPKCGIQFQQPKPPTQGNPDSGGA